MTTIALPTLEAIQAEKARRAQRSLYRDDPAAFVRECIAWKDDEGPAAYQDEVLTEFARRHRASIRAPHGVGKTTLSAWIILWFAMTRDGEDWKIVTTASAWRQLVKYTWPELHKWARRLRFEKFGRAPFDTRTELLTLSLKLKTGEAFAAASDQPELIEGAHADHLLYVFDESKAIIAKTFDAAEGAFSGAGTDTRSEAFALSISTPGEPSGRFYEIQSRKPGLEDWWVRHITLEEAIAAGRVSREWAAQRARQWGESSAVYQSRVLGEFASADETSVIPLAWVEAAQDRWREREERGDFGQGSLTSLGVDVAYTGEDENVLAPRRGDVVLPLIGFTKSDTMATTGRVAGMLRAHGGRPVVDVIGIGAGVVDRLREQEFIVVPFNASVRCVLLDRTGELGFANLRSAAWWHLREALDPTYGSEVALPPDDGLTGDLTAPKWRVASTGKIEVESKDTIKARIGRSTDRGDAVVQAFALEIIDPTLAPPSMFTPMPERTEQVRQRAAAEELAALVARSGGYFPGGR